MSKKILLIDIDSKIPNLALMKISAYHKKLGDDVGFNNTDCPDVIYASVVFQKNKHLVDGLKFYYPDSKIVIGGSGYDISLKLPDEIEFLKPDYVLYPNMNYSLGYTTRGCNRTCGFCIVPKKEGKFQIWQHPQEWYDPRFNGITFLDNNILLDKIWFKEVITFCIEHDLKMQFNQGIDIRLLDETDIKLLREVKHLGLLGLAWDSLELEPIILQKLNLLRIGGFNLRSEIQLFCYVDSDKQFDSGLYRANKLKEIGTNAFIMFNPNSKKSKRIIDLQRWTNRRWAFWGCDFNEFKRKDKNGYVELST